MQMRVLAYGKGHVLVDSVSKAAGAAGTDGLRSSLSGSDQSFS